MQQLPQLATHGEYQRFIVYKYREGSSLCVCVSPLKALHILSAQVSSAIHTYGDQGTTAPHIRAKNHSQAYTTPSPPPLIPGENPRQLLRPIKINPTTNTYYDLKPASRIDFARIFTFEHNLPIAVLGHVDPNDLGQFLQYVRLRCFDEE
jgi:hypothetical protein